MCIVERCLVVVQRENDRIETKTEAEREKTSVRRSKLLFSETRRKKIDEKAKLKQNLFIASVQCTAELLLLRSFGRWQCHHSDFQSHIRNKIAYKPGQARTMLRKYSNNIVDAPSHPEITQRTHRDHKKRMRIIKTLTSVVANVENYKSISIMIQSLFSVFILATHSLRLGSAINSFGETTAANAIYYTLTHTDTWWCMSSPHSGARQSLTCCAPFLIPKSMGPACIRGRIENVSHKLLYCVAAAAAATQHAKTGCSCVSASPRASVRVCMCVSESWIMWCICRWAHCRWETNKWNWKRTTCTHYSNH